MASLFSLFFVILLFSANTTPAGAESKKAAFYRQAHKLVPCNPPERFMAGNFVTAEMSPHFIFGTIHAFASSRPFPTTWLRETDEQNRFTFGESREEPGEYFVYLEEDCPDKPVYYVFVNQSGVSPSRWIQWRRFFFKSTTEEQYAPVKARLNQALKEGFGVGAELSFIVVDGKTPKKSPEEILLHDLKFKPLYDLRKQQRIFPPRNRCQAVSY